MKKNRFFYECDFHCLMKTFRIMRIIVFLILASILQTFANDAYSQKTKLSFDFQGTKLVDLLDEIENKTEFYFLFNEKLIDTDRKVNMSVKNEKIDAILDQLFSGTDVVYTITDRKIILAPSFLSENEQQQKTITGRITDSRNKPLPGVTVVVKGTTQGTVTSADGNFSLNIPSTAEILMFSFIGMRTQELAIEGRTTFMVVMEEETIGVEEVVVVGYGTQKKINLTGAITAVSGVELENMPVVDATHSLQGLVPGLNVNVGSNTKPGESFSLNIRGMGNLNGNDSPYILVDGMEMSLSDVNPKDIESISVLKDASVSAIYGSRAAFGVILVTTKKGSPDKTTFSYSGNVGLTTPIKLPELVNSLDFAKYFNAGTYNALGTEQYSELQLQALEQYIKNPTGMSILPTLNSNFYTNWEDTPNGVANTNWLNFHYKKFSVKQNHNLSISGGNKITQYFISGGYYTEGGSMRYADINYDRFNLNANISSQVLSWAKIKLNTKYTESNYDDPFPPDFEDSFFHNIIRMRPNVSPYDLNGNFNEQSVVPYLQSGAYSKQDRNMLGLLSGIELEPIKKWKINFDLNLRGTTSEQSYLKVPGTLYGVDGTPFLALRSGYKIPEKGSYGRTMTNQRYVSSSVYNTYSFNINENHNFDIIAGFQQESNEFKNLSADAQDLISFNRPGISLVTGDKTVDESRTHWATRGVFGRLSYNYKTKILLEMNGRYDGSSRFAPDSRWGFFPSFSAGYNLGNERFIQEKIGWLDQLKIRGSYGFIGNQSGAGLYSYSENMNITVPGIGTGGGWFFNNGREPYISVPSSFNPFTTWEKIETSNIGVDFAALNRKLIGSFDIYQRNTRDMLGPSVDLPDMYGGNPPSTNNADLRTRGWEMSISWRGAISKDVSYTLGVLVADNKSMVTKYQNPLKSNPDGSWYVGKMAGEIWGYKSPGLIQTPEDADEYNKLDLSYISAQPWLPGDVIYEDLNKDEKINQGTNILGDMGDLTIIGNSSPRYSYSITGSITWKNLSMNMLWQGIGMMDYAPAWNDAYFWGSGSPAQVVVTKQHLDYWTPENPDAYYPNPYIAPAKSLKTYAYKTQLLSDRYLQNASYLRLKNLTFNYTLPISWTQKLKLEKINVFFSGENLLTITKLVKMLDPELLVGVDGNVNSAGKIYPLNKVYSFGLNLNF